MNVCVRCWRIYLQATSHRAHIVRTRLWLPADLQGRHLESAALKGSISPSTACICIGSAHMEVSRLDLDLTASRCADSDRPSRSDGSTGGRPLMAGPRQHSGRCGSPPARYTVTHRAREPAALSNRRSL